MLLEVALYLDSALSNSQVYNKPLPLSRIPLFRKPFLITTSDEQCNVMVEKLG